SGLPKRNPAASGYHLPRRLPLTRLYNAEGDVYIAGNGRRTGLFLAKAQRQVRLFVLKKWGGIAVMFSHIMIGTNDLDKAKTFYDALLGTLGVKPARVDGHRIFYRTKTGVFSVSKP